MTADVLAVVWTLSAGFAAILAQGKGRSAGWFAVAGLLLGVIGLLWAAFATPESEVDRRGPLSRHL